MTQIYLEWDIKTAAKKKQVPCRPQNGLARDDNVEPEEDTCF
jgi:hypothetical protein